MVPEPDLERFTLPIPFATGADGERLARAWEEVDRTGDITPVLEHSARRGRGSVNGTVGIIANPVSGRDVRRVAARGAVSTTEDKRNRIARAVIGAVTAGATRIVAMAEPFGIATGALTDLRINAEIEIVDVGATVSPADTVRAVEAMRARDVEVLVTLGGDGTNRTVSAVWPEATLVPMSTGTNNVFPSLTEPTVAGAAAGLVASGVVDAADCAPRSKLIAIELSGSSTDIALIDAVTLADDFVGNRMPADGALIRQVLVSRAHPASIGLSSLAGLLRPCSFEEDAGVLVECGPGGQPMRVALAPGLYRTVSVLDHREVPLGVPVELRGPTVLSLDGDREHTIDADDVASAEVRRCGPRVVDVERALELGAAAGVFTTTQAPTGNRALNERPTVHYHHADGTPIRDCC
ncbi:NAD(+)/NADH kinase [Candidatus Poriferisodalis sp.]|uniref:NAD(+)/NADH kinase n=1 Tax=Candidatus Poriferisodalis sp. TaxID=3101277 RepID=UPI003AF8979C